MSIATSPYSEASHDLAGFRRRLGKRLERFRQRLRRQLLLEGVVRVVAVAVMLLLASLILDWWLRLSLPMRLVCLAAMIVTLAVETWRHIIRPMQLELSDLDLASIVDRAGGRQSIIAPRVATVLQLSERVADAHGATVMGASQSMIHRAVARSFDALQGVHFDQHFDTRRQTHAIMALAVALLVPLLVILAAPSAVGLWGKRWFFASNQPWPQKTYLQVVGLNDDGRIIVPRGEPYMLRIAAKPNSIEIPETVSLEIDPEEGKAVRATMTRFDDEASAGDFRHELLTVASPMTIQAWGGDDVLAPFVIEPVDRPRIARLQLTAKHPTDAQAQTIDFSGQAAPSFLAMTQIELRLTSNVPLREARVRAMAKTHATTQPAGGLPALKRIDETTYSMSWTHEQAMGFDVELTASTGGLTSPPTPVSIGLKIDQPPRVSMQHSGVRQRVSPMAKIPLSILARDDYGLARLDLAWKAEHEAAATTQGVSLSDVINLAGPVSPATELEIQKSHLLELAPLKLVPNMVLSLTGDATDANYLGAETGRSRPLAFRIVSPEDLFREILSRQQGERARFRKAIDDMKALRDQMQTITSADGVPAVARQFRLLQRESARIHKSLDDSLTEMKLNALGGQDAYTLMQNNVLTPLKTLNEAMMSQQREAIDSLAGNFSEPALSNISARQEEVIAEMERILKQMSQWDSFVDVLNQLNEVIKLQEAAREMTEKLRTTETEGVFEP